MKGKCSSSCICAPKLEDEYVKAWNSRQKAGKEKFEKKNLDMKRKFPLKYGHLNHKWEFEKILVLNMQIWMV